MLSFSESKLMEAYTGSSPAVKSILNDVWIPESVEIIGKKFKLRIDKIGELIKIIGFVTLDLVSISKFTDIVEENLELSRSNAEDVAQEIDEYVFSKIRTKVREYNSKEKSEEINDDKSSLIGGLKNEAEDFDNKLDSNIQTNKKISVDPYREITD